MASRGITNLTTFNYLSNTVRVVEIDGQPWFVVADVCAALEIGRSDNLLRHLYSDQKSVTPQRVRALMPDLHHRSVIISESGLYKLIMRSDKPEARKFQDWVTREVLPAIRKDGMYVAGEEKLKTERPVAGEVEIIHRFIMYPLMGLLFHFPALPAVFEHLECIHLWVYSMCGCNDILFL